MTYKNSDAVCSLDIDTFERQIESSYYIIIVIISGNYNIMLFKAMVFKSSTFVPEVPKVGACGLFQSHSQTQRLRL